MHTRHNICMKEHSYFPYTRLELHASQFKQKTQHPSHALRKHPTYFITPRLKTFLATQQTFLQTHYSGHQACIIYIILSLDINNKIHHTPPPHIISSEETLPRLAHRTIQNKSLTLSQIILTQRRRQLTSITTVSTL